jgi:hypothetical protein
MTAAAVSAAVKTRVVEVSVTRFQAPDVPILCAFQTSSVPPLTVQIGAFPFTTGRYKSASLASIKDGITAAAGEGPPTRIIEHPEWGADAFSALIYNSGHAVGIQDWTPKYFSSIDGNVSESAYLADATKLGNALVAASK